MRCFLTLLLFAVATPAFAQEAEADVAAILALNDEAAEAWNRADIDGHVAMYADSAGFMTGRGPAFGRQTIADMLARSFFRDGRPVQQLRFEDMTVRMLGADHAYVTGHFILSGGGQEDNTGWFTTIWARTPEGWQLIHDHSS
jgi:uncharacterized protein (TIGR02246 family)